MIDFDINGKNVMVVDINLKLNKICDKELNSLINLARNMKDSCAIANYNEHSDELFIIFGRGNTNVDCEIVQSDKFNIILDKKTKNVHGIIIENFMEQTIISVMESFLK